MPLWIMIIFQIISNLPTIIKIIKMILDLIRKLPTQAERVDATTRLKSIMKDVKTAKGMNPDHVSRLHALLKDLEARAIKVAK